MSDGRELWLCDADLANVFHLYDSQEGRLIRTLKKPTENIIPVGIYAACRRGGAALYNEDRNLHTILQVGSFRYPADDHQTAFRFDSASFGLAEKMTVSHPLIGASSVTGWVVATLLLRTFDPGFDELDASVATGIRVIRGIVEDRLKLENFKEYSEIFRR